MDMQQKQIAAGETIFTEGESGDRAYLIATGTVGIFRTVDGEESLLGELEAGQLFGAMALYSNKTRTAPANAQTDVGCFEMANVVL